MFRSAEGTHKALKIHPPLPVLEILANLALKQQNLSKTNARDIDKITYCSLSFMSSTHDRLVDSCLACVDQRVSRGSGTAELPGF